MIKKLICKIKGHKNDKMYIISKCPTCFEIIENENKCRCKHLGIRFDLYRCDLCGKFLVPHILNYYRD